MTRKKRDSAKTARPSAKKKYQAPRLVEYGDLRKIVMSVGKASNRNDGASAPATKR